MGFLFLWFSQIIGGSMAKEAVSIEEKIKKMNERHEKKKAELKRQANMSPAQIAAEKKAAQKAKDAKKALRESQKDARKEIKDLTASIIELSAEMKGLNAKRKALKEERTALKAKLG